jgi:hypothetical protein
MGLIKGILGIGLGIGAELLLGNNDSNGNYYGGYTTEELHSKLEGYSNELSELTAKINSLNTEIRLVNEELKNRISE